jgi:CHAT domain-containing protein
MKYLDIYGSALLLILLGMLPAAASNSFQGTAAPQAANLPASNNSVLAAAQAANQRGAAFLAVGKADRALTEWQQAYKLYSQAQDLQGMIGSQINQAQALQAQGFYRQALLLLQKVHGVLEQQPNSELKVQGLLALGNSLRSLRILEQKSSTAGQTVNSGSREVLQRALGIATKLNDQPAIDRINLSLGNTLSLIVGAEETAIATYQKIDREANPLIRTQAQINLFRLQSARGTAPDPLEFMADTQKTLSNIIPSRSTIYTYINLAETIKNHRPNAAQDQKTVLSIARILVIALQQAQSIQDARGEAQALGSLGGLYATTGQTQEAIKLTRKALLISENISAPDLAYRFYWQLGKTIMKSQPSDREQEVATVAYRQAIGHLKTIRNDLQAIDAEVQFSFRDSVEPVYREYVSLLLKEDKPIPPEDLATARDAIESLQVAELENFLRQGCLDTYRVPLDQIDVSSAVVYPIILPDRIATIISIPGQPLRYHSRKIESAKMEESIADFKSKILDPNFSTAQERALQKKSQELYNAILAPVASALVTSRTKTLVFVLDGALRSIPMSALYDGQKYLVESYNIALTPGLQLVPPRSGKTSQGFQALIGGISEGRSGFSALPGVRSELEAIGKLMPNQQLLNEQFSRRAVSTQLVDNNAQIVHLATHGQFSSKPEDTFILTWDGRLDLDQLSNLLNNRSAKSLNDIDLLVLSACQTATGDNRAILGLAGVAIKARAKSTIASLWSVSDEATQDLMIRFYQNLTTQKLNKGESLRRAQLALLQNPKYRSPYYWAPFVLIGNWQ